MWRELKESVTTSVNVSWLSDVVKLELDQNREMLSAIAQGERSKTNLAENLDLTKWSITKSVLKMEGLTLCRIFVSVAYALMLPMVVALAVALRKGKRKNDPSA